MKRILLLAALLLLLAVGGGLLWYGLHPTASPWERQAAVFGRGLEEKNVGVLRECMLVYHLLPGDRAEYGYPSDEPELPEWETLRAVCEDWLAGQLSAPTVIYESDEAVPVSKQRITLRSVKWMGCTAEPDPEAAHPTYRLTLYLQAEWQDGRDQAHTSVMEIADHLRAVEYRGNWYLIGL